MRERGGGAPWCAVCARSLGAGHDPTPAANSAPTPTATYNINATSTTPPTTTTHHIRKQPANFLLRDRKANPLGSPNDPRMHELPWLAAIDLGCAQHLGPDVS